jgi:hypothetical protein
MNRSTSSRLSVVALAGLVGGCGGNDRRNGGDGEGVDRVTVVLREHDSGAARLAGVVPADSAAGVCAVRDGAVTGVCITPDSARGWAEKINLAPPGNQNTNNCGPGRLLAVNSTTDVGGPFRGGGAFDLEETRPIGGQSNLECQDYRAVTWAALAVTMPHLDVDFVAGGRRFTVRFVFESNPITLEPPVAACGLDETYVREYEYKPGVELRRGDVLACVADPSAAPCEDADFRFVDLDAQALTATRPAQPLTMAYMEALEVASAPNVVEGDIWCRTACEPNSPQCGFVTSTYSVGFTLPSEARLGLWAEWVPSDDPRHPGASDSSPPAADGGPDGGAGVAGPAKLYHVVDADGEERAGYDPELTIRFDLTDLLFLAVAPDTTVDQLGEVELLRSLSLRDMANRGDPHNFGVEPVQTATLEIDFATVPGQQDGPDDQSDAGPDDQSDAGPDDESDASSDIEPDAAP